MSDSEASPGGQNEDEHVPSTEREVHFESPPLPLTFLEVPLPSIYGSVGESDSDEAGSCKVVVVTKEGLNTNLQLCSVLPPDAILTHIDQRPLPIPPHIVPGKTDFVVQQEAFSSNADAMSHLERWSAVKTPVPTPDSGIDDLSNDGLSERPPPLLLRFYVPPALDDMCHTTPAKGTVVVDSASTSTEPLARRNSSCDSLSGDNSENEASMLDALVSACSLENDGDSEDEDYWQERERGGVIGRVEDDLTAGLVSDVNDALLEKLEKAGLDTLILSTSVKDIKDVNVQKRRVRILPSSFIRKFSSLYSWEIARILHAFDKLADNFVDLLQTQITNDATRQAEQLHHLEMRSQIANGEHFGQDTEHLESLFSKEEEDDDDLIDSLVQDKNVLLQESIGSNNRYRFRNSVADALFNLERATSRDSDASGREGNDGARRGRRGSHTDRRNDGVGVYEVSLHSRQLGMTIENVMERTVVRAVHPNSEAARLRVKRDSVILKIGAASTLTQTHLETLDSLKNSVRPVKLRLCTISLPVLQQHRSRMQSLVQRRKNLAIGACTTLNWIETRVLFVLELVAFMEGLSAINPPPLPESTTDLDGRHVKLNGGQTHRKDRVKKHEARALVILEKYKKAKYAFFENSRREALVNTRLQVLSEIMYDVYLLMDWKLAKVQTESGISLSEGRSAVGLISQSLRDICYTLLQLTNDQQVDMQLIFPDHHTCLVIDRLVQVSLNPYMIKTHHIPSLWRLAGGAAPPARLASANLVPQLYMNMSPIQRLRIRGLLNRLLVDTVPVVRAYVLNSVCVRLLHAVVSRPKGDGIESNLHECEPATVTLNWISHVLVQGSLDPNVDVRQSALLACNQMIEYHSLGLAGTAVNESQALSQRLRNLLVNVGKPPASRSMVFKSMEPIVNGDEEEYDPGHSQATLEYFNRNKPLSFADDFQASNDINKDKIYDDNSINFDPKLVFIPSLADAHIMFCRMLPLVSRLVEDDKPALRAAVVSMCGDFCIWMGGKWSAILLDVMLCCFRDEEEAVRAAAVNAVPHAVLALVKTAVISESNYNYESIAKLFVSLIPAVCTMHSDTSVAVRMALCRNLSQVLALLYAVSRKGTLSSFQFLPKMQIQMCDVMIMLLEDKALEVSCEMLTEIAACLDKEEQESGDKTWYTSLLFTRKNSLQLIRSITFLSKPPSHWRVRRLVCLLIPRLVATTTTVEERTSISNIVVPLLYDEVFEVRKTAARAFCLSAVCDYNPSTAHTLGEENSGDLNEDNRGMNANVFSKNPRKLEESLSATPSSTSLTPSGEPLQDMGQMWLDCFVLPQMESLRTSRVYHQRILALHMIVLLIKEEVVQVRDVRFNILVNIALTLVDDRIANVRLAVCKLLDELREYVFNHCPRYREEKFNEKLDNDRSASNLALIGAKKLRNDQDRDVKYLASKLHDNIEADYKIYCQSIEEAGT